MILLFKTSYQFFLGRALGFPDGDDGLSSSLVDSILNDTARLHTAPESSHTPSMMLDAEKGQAIEVEVILGEVVRMARQASVDIPASARYFWLEHRALTTKLAR